MNLTIGLLLILLLVSFGIIGFLYKISVDNKNAYRQLRSIVKKNQETTDNSISSCKKDLTSIQTQITELTKIDEME